MKDLTLTDINAAVVAKFRVEMLQNNPANIEILDIFNSADVKQDSLLISGTIWRKLNYSWQAFIAFCTTNNYKIFAADSNGSNGVISLANQVPPGTAYPVVSATASAILLATDLHLLFLSAASVSIYNADNTLFGTYTLSANSTYSAPNTTLATTVAVGTIAVSSGAYLIHN